MLKALHHVLIPVVRVLLRNGISWGDFTEVAKEAFVQIAREDYGVQGRPTNTSRVALMTGLSRREVTRVKHVLLGERASEPGVPSRISQILTAWHVDPRFTTSDGKPATLPATARGADMTALLKNYAGDTPHGAVIKEMTELGLVERTPQGFRALAREYIRAAPTPISSDRQVSHCTITPAPLRTTSTRSAPVRRASSAWPRTERCHAGTCAHLRRSSRPRASHSSREPIAGSRRVPPLRLTTNERFASA